MQQQCYCKNDKGFATARGYGDFKGQWEFPGGEIKPGEMPDADLKREIVGVMVTSRL